MNGRSSKAKGVRAEQEVARLIHEHTGHDVRRTLAGHADDLGDISGLPGVTCQIKSYDDVGRAVREGVAELCDQQARSGTPYAAAFIRRPRARTDSLDDRYVVVMKPSQFFALWREATCGGTIQPGGAFK